ncbi:MAG: hypothetical protein WBE76_13500 [Terracidiphilus sp.]
MSYWEATILAHIPDKFERFPISLEQRFLKGNVRRRGQQPNRRVSLSMRYHSSRMDPIHAPVERLPQGPVADTLTHVGQLAMLRRMAGSPALGENFYVAAISAGQVDAEQLEPIEPFR